MIKLYQTSQKQFLIPLENTHFINLQSYMQYLLEQSSRLLADGCAKSMQQLSEDWALRIEYVRGLGVIQILVAKDSQGHYQSTNVLGSKPQYFIADCELKLSEASAKALRNDLGKLYQKYLYAQEASGQPC